MTFLRRFLYLLLLVASFFYYIFHTQYLSWVLLIIMITLPFLSLLLTLLFRQKCRVLVKCDADPKTGLIARLKVDPALPYTPVRIKILFENLFDGDSVSKKIVMNHRDSPRSKLNLRYEGEKCGVIRVSVRSAHISDLLGLFYLPIRIPEPVETLLLPAEIPFDGSSIDWPSADAEHIPKEKTAGISGEREYRDIRPYREGDLLRDIHWKLTARTGRAIVREYEFSSASLRKIAIHWEGECETLCLALQRLLGVIRYFSAHGQYLLLFFEETEHRYISPDLDALTSLFWAVLSKPPATKATGSAPEGCVLLIRPDSIVLSDHGLQREVPHE